MRCRAKVLLSFNGVLLKILVTAGSKRLLRKPSCLPAV